MHNHYIVENTYLNLIKNVSQIMNRRMQKMVFIKIHDLIETLECDELRFLEIIEPEYEKEIEINMAKKHCVL